MNLKKYNGCDFLVFYFAIMAKNYIFALEIIPWKYIFQGNKIS